MPDLTPSEAAAMLGRLSHRTPRNKSMLAAAGRKGGRARWAGRTDAEAKQHAAVMLAARRLRAALRKLPPMLADRYLVLHGLVVAGQATAAEQDEFRRLWAAAQPKRKDRNE